MEKSLPLLSYDFQNFDNPLSQIFIAREKIIDVRAPVEFLQGHLPGSINLPILDDDERALIGTVYKQSGKDAALKLGLEIVSGQNKQNKLNSWINVFQMSPQTLITCFRGGLRSQITQSWITESDFTPLRLDGGYKQARSYLQHVINQLPQRSEMIVVSGRTGSNKTKLIQQLALQNFALDLEAIAKHRGSAFGGHNSPQPTQAQFENEFAVEFLRLLQKQNCLSNGNATLFLEDESRMIGKITQPESLFEQLRASPVLLIEESLEVRVENIFKEYILDSELGRSEDSKNNSAARNVFTQFKHAINCISKKLGGKESSEIMTLINECEIDFLKSGELSRNREWISRLLKNYYDAFYDKSLEKRNPAILARSNYSGIEKWCLEKISKN